MLNIIMLFGLAMAQETPSTTQKASQPECSIQDFHDVEGKLVVHTKFCSTGNDDFDRVALSQTIQHLDTMKPPLGEVQREAIIKRAQRDHDELMKELERHNDTPSSLDPMVVWQGIAATPALVEYFKDTFDTMGIRVEDSNKSFTVTHTGTALELSDGIVDDVNFRVTISQQQVRNMVDNAADNSISEQESWRILSVLFTPMTAVTLKNKIFTNNWRRIMLGVEDHIHVYLLNPSGETATSHTLFFSNGQWVVVKGLHGTPKRTFKLTPKQALEYQKKTFSAMRANNSKQWNAWAKWYKKWRKGVSKIHK